MIDVPSILNEILRTWNKLAFPRCHSHYKSMVILSYYKMQTNVGWKKMGKLFYKEYLFYWFLVQKYPIPETKCSFRENWHWVNLEWQALGILFKLLLCLGIRLVTNIKETASALAKNKMTTRTYLFTTIFPNGSKC